MAGWQEMALTIFTSVLASSGVWTLILKLMDKKDAKNDMLRGLAHDRILALGLEYISRDPQYITDDEYDNLYNYLYLPYKQLGGNGTAERVMDEVKRLPIRKDI